MRSVLLLAAALSASSPSRSMLGVMVEGDDDTARALLDVCPRLAVFPVPSNGSAAAQIAAYKASCPEGIAIVRVGAAGMRVDATTVRILGPLWEQQVGALGLTPGQDGVEGPSEPVGSPRGLAAFWADFAILVNGMNLRPIVGALPSGMFGLGSRATDPFCTTVDALRFPGTLTFWWSYHARSPTMTTNALREALTSLGYRQIRADCSLVGVPLVITEAGPSGRAWDAADAEWLAWLDARLAEDADRPGTPGVKGAAVVAAGTGARDDLGPVLADVLVALAKDESDGGSRQVAAQATPSSGIARDVTSTPAKGCSRSGAGTAVLTAIPVLWVLRHQDRRNRTHRASTPVP
jgi:hypothetical protein